MPGPLFILPSGIETRWATPENQNAQRGQGGTKNSGRKGSACLPIKKREQHVLAHVSGTSGTIRRIWATISSKDPIMLRGLKFDIYWEGSQKPAVSAPFGDFFGMGLGRMSKFNSTLFSSPEGRSFNCFAPMPFRNEMKIVVTNETDTDLQSLFYDVDFTVGDKHPENMLYFHAHYRRENPTFLLKDFEFLPKITGKGRFIGINAGIAIDKKYYSNSWWGEGEVKVYLDGDNELPTLCGTGTEDYIGTAWGTGQFDSMYQGCHLADEENCQFCFYRYHIPDPIYFHKDIRVTIQQIGCYDPKSKDHFKRSDGKIYALGNDKEPVDFSGDLPEYGLFERQDDMSSCAYFYIDKPETSLPSIDPVEDRIKGLITKKTRPPG